MIKIPLTQGLFAKISNRDQALIASYKWRACKDGASYYAIAHIWRRGRRTTIKMHRLILGLINSKLRGDHKDGDGLNNQRSNLRACNASQNSWNRKKNTKRKHRYIGVAYDNTCKANPWRASITNLGKVTDLGHHGTQEAAARAYDKTARLLRGKFAKLNFV